MPQLAFIGFGEAGAAFMRGLGRRTEGARVYDPRLCDPVQRERVSCEFEHLRICRSAAAAVSGADGIFSLVTADLAVSAANSIGPLRNTPLYFDCNSCAPESKREAAAAVAGFGGRYVDVAVMAPVVKSGVRTPLLASGPHAAEAARFLTQAGMKVRALDADIGAAAAVKLLRSIVVKGMQALVTEAALAARSEELDDEFLRTIADFMPEIDWRERIAFNLSRMIEHGERRVEEMQAAVAMLQSTGLPSDMSLAAIHWERRIAGLKLSKETPAAERIELLLALLRDRNEAADEAAPSTKDAAV